MIITTREGGNRTRLTGCSTLFLSGVITLNKYRWEENPPPDPDTVQSLVDEFDIPPVGARFLVARSITDRADVKSYLYPEATHSHDPFQFEHMGAAVEAVRAAIARKQPLLIHGDYDVDGISGTALLYLYLRDLFPEVFRFVPDRRKDGYGVAERAVAWAIEQKVGLVIVVDCGTSDGELIGELESHDIPVIVCDHHEFPVDKEVRGVMLNPSRAEETYPFRSLCGTGVAYKLVDALHQSGIRGREHPEALLDLMALATVGDVSPLVDENRYFVRAGLELINRSPRPGLEALKGVARMRNRAVTSTHIAFMLAPRINAPGRISRPKPSLEILCAEEKQQAIQLASVLENDNERRKELTEMVRREVIQRIEAMDGEQPGGYVVAGEGWDEGVLGIAAARVAEEYGRPAIIMTVSGDTAKGSGRSVPGVNLKEHLDQFQDCFVRYGGHAQAVGLTMKAARVGEFGAGLSRRLQQEMSGRPGGRSLHIDGTLELEDCSLELLSFFARCEPFGHGNKAPLWRLSNVQILRESGYVGDNHMKLFFRDMRGNGGEAIAFSWDRPETPGDLHDRSVDLAVQIKQGEYRGRVYPEMRLVDIRSNRD